MKKSDPRQNIVLVIIIVLAVLVGTAVVIEEKEKERKPLPRPPAHKPVLPPSTPPRIVREYALPEFLIKGCLFDLGLARGDVRFHGNTVQVTVRSMPSRERVVKAFAPLKGAGAVYMEKPGRFRVVINGSGWDIVFSRIDEKVARCAIIVDDMGQSMEVARRLGRINANLTFAVLPNLPESRPVAEHLHSRHRELLLHLPMEGNGKNPGPGAILGGMSDDEVRSVLDENLKCVPFISGVNNHMGSAITADPGDMGLILGDLKKQGLFFVDSLTTSKSVCGTLAHDFGVPFIARDVFLDNERSAAYITAQIQKLVSISLRHTSAVAICHPYPETIAVLEKEIPRMKRRGVDIVRVSSLTDKTAGGR